MGSNGKLDIQRNIIPLFTEVSLELNLRVEWDFLVLMTVCVLVSFQMGNPMGHMGPPGGMMQGYQGWGTPPQQSGYPPQGYNPGGGQSYQGWGAAQATQGQQMPQWGSYGATPQQSYGYGERVNNLYSSSSRYFQ